MTTVIDERVVEMRFNNADFEKNVAQSMSTLDSLKKSLNFDSAKSLEELGKASKGFSLAGITETITEATSKFSVLEIAGITAIAKITSAAMDMGTALVKSLSVDQVSMGFDKYAMKTQAVQTIIAATGEDIKTVTDEINKLNWFTDETSYNLVDMTNNIAKFTSNGVALHDAVTQMMGIANAAALAGGNAESASHAMEGFSKAIAKGKMDRQNWKWIQTARMDTMQFKQSLIEAGVAAGTLTQVADGYFETLKGHEVTLTNFEENMKDGWMTAQVMSKALETYGDFSVRLNEVYDTLRKTQSNLTTSELLDYVDDYKNGVLDLQETADYLNISTEELESTMQSLSDDALALGNKAFRAGQEAKTFREAIDSVKDAVSTGWMNTFELIFGNYEQAKKLWTGLANTMWDVFAAGGERRNETLRLWSERNSLIEAFVNLLNVVIGPLNAVREAWYSLFADQASERAKTLDKLTRSFKEFTKTLIPSEKMLGNLYLTFQGLFNAGKLVASAFTAIVKAIIPAARPFGSLLEMFTTFTAYIGAFITAISEYAEEMGIFRTITEALSGIFEKLISALKLLGGLFVGGVYLGTQKFISIIGKLVSATDNFIKNSKTIQSVLSKIKKGFDSLKRIISGTERPIEKVNTVIKKMDENFASASSSGVIFGTVTKGVGDNSNKALTPIQKLGNAVKLVATVIGAAALTIGKGIITLFTNFSKLFDGLRARFAEANKNSTTIFDYIKSVFVVLGGLLSDAAKKIGEFFESLGIDTSKVKGAFDTITGALSNLIKNLTPGRILAIALSVALLALVGAAVDVASKFRDMAAAISGVFTSLNKILKKQFSKTSMITDIAKAFAMIAGSLALLTLVDQTKLKNAAGIMAAFVGVFTVLSIVIGALSKKIEGAQFRKNFSGISRSILMLSASMTVLAAALAILSKIDIESANEAWWKVEMALVLLGGVTAAAIALSKYSATLPKGSVLLLALAFSMRQLVKALAEFSELPYEDVDKHWAGFISMFAGLAGVIAAAGQIKLGSALGILVLAKALQMILPAFSDIVDEINKLPLTEMLDTALKKMDANKTFIAATIGFIGFVSIISAKMKSQAKPSIGNVFKGIGGVMAGLGIGIYLITKAIKEISVMVSSMNGNQWAATLSTVLGMVLGILSFFAGIAAINSFDTTGTLDKDFKSMAVAMIGLGGSFILIAKAVDIIAKTNMNGLVAANATIIGIGAVLGVILYAAGNVKKAIPAVAALIGACTAIGILIGEIAIMSILISSAPNINESLAVMGGVMLSLVVLMATMEKIKDVKTGPMIALAASLAIIGASLAVLSYMPLEGVIGAMIAMAGVMTMFTVVVDKISNMTTKATNIGTAITMVAMLLTVGISLAKIAEQPWESIAAAGGAMSAAVLAISAALLILGKVDPIDSVVAAGAILLVSTAMLAIGNTLRMMEGIDWGTFGMFAAAIGVLGGVLGILAGISAACPLFAVALLVVGAAMLMASGSFLIIAVAFNVFAAALPALADGINLLIPALTNLANVPFVKLAGELLLFGGTAVVLALLAPSMITASIGIATFSGALMLLTVALSGIGTGFEVLANGITLVGNTIVTVVENIKTAINGLLSDMASAFQGGAAVQVIAAATTLAQKIAGGKNPDTGFIGGLASVLKWHSPPGVVDDLLTDTGTAFANNQTAVSAAQQSGEQIGDGFGKSLLSSLSSWLSGVGDMISSAFSGMGTSVSGATNDMSKDLGTAGAQAEKFGRQLDGTSKKAGLFANIQEKVNSGLDKGKELFGDLANPMDFINDETSNLTDNLLGGTDAANGFGDALEGAGGKAGKAGKDLKDFGETLKDTITNQLDIFNKFEIKQGITANQMLENMKSNIDGFASWSHRLAVLAERGIDQALYQKLAEMGPKGYETVAAFVQMTDEQLQEANQLFATSMSLPESQASIVQAGFIYAGEMAAKGFSTALDDHKQAHAAAQGLAKAAIEGVDETLQIHSPSKVMWQRGWYSQLGFRDGFRAGQPITINIIGMLCREIVEAFETGLGPEVFEQVGTTMLGNLFASILETSEEEPNPIITAMCEALTTFDLIDEAITLFVEHMKEMFNTLFEMGEGGQSMWFYNFANFGIIQSMINALVANEVFLLTQLLMLGTGIMNTLRGPFGDEGKTLPQIAYDVGMNIALGLRDGINDYAEEAIAAARAMAEAVIAILESIPDINSPSKVTRKLGGFISQGYAIGIEDGAGNVYNAARNVAESAIDGISSGRIQDILNSEFDFNPVITPILDLTYVREQLEELSDIMAIPVDAAVSQNEANNTKNSPSQINFTQNNYSPKSLSRYEIYRQTKNQISQLKGVMA
ncbi:hypothetical protein [Butyrivibrio sp. INlla21]|uniref:hypothetical protein n=1 Tax=Butyrivibrio sp. INlla21 TaxID=1520811 RepID=UPI0008EC7014|nr:hypothetical protein [Butyrivibrio sp. INlla21]SFU33506.1 hypothetical protein SAMN02910342_00124 [Butyrivibrio sp. INlla21]